MKIDHRLGLPLTTLFDSTAPTSSPSLLNPLPTHSPSYPTCSIPFMLPTLHAPYPSYFLP